MAIGPGRETIYNNVIKFGETRGAFYGGDTAVDRRPPVSVTQFPRGTWQWRTSV